MSKDELQRLDERLDGLCQTLERLTASVEHHVKRTDALEALVLPLYKAGERAKGAAWVVGLLVTAVLAARSLNLL